MNVSHGRCNQCDNNFQSTKSQMLMPHKTTKTLHNRGAAGIVASGSAIVVLIRCSKQKT